MAKGKPIAWPSDVSVLAHIRCGRVTQDELGRWLAERTEGSAFRTAKEYAVRALVRLQNDGLISVRRNVDDLRVLEYRAVK